MQLFVESISFVLIISCLPHKLQFLCHVEALSSSNLQQERCANPSVNIAESASMAANGPSNGKQRLLSRGVIIT